MALRAAVLVALLAQLLTSTAAAAAPKPKPLTDEEIDKKYPCPEFGKAVCRGQPCGQPPSHSFAYALRVGHLDYDWESGLLYNQGLMGPDFKKWHYFQAPDPEDIDGWCLEDCVHTRQALGAWRDKNQPCREGDGKAAAPPKRPPVPRAVRCFMGDYLGGIDYASEFPRCGARSEADFGFNDPYEIGIKRTGKRYKVGGGDDVVDEQECTGGNPNCVCAKSNPGAFSKYSSAAANAVGRAFPNGQKPAGMTDAEATKKICEAYTAFPSLGEGSSCRSQNDEIVIEAPGGKYPAVSVDVVTSEGRFWSKAIAACASGVH